MIIGIDARELERKATGVGNYLWNILLHVKAPQGARLRLYFKNEIPEKVTAIDADAQLIQSNGSNLVWEQIRLQPFLKDQSVRLLFSPAGSCPFFFNGKRVVTIHDLSYFHYPQWFPVKERFSRKIGARVSFRVAERIYVISEHVQEELISTGRVEKSKIVLTPIGVTPKQVDAQLREQLRRGHGFDSKKLVLYVGSIFQRRHLPVLIEAISHLQNDYHLVIIGENRTHPPLDLASISRHFHVEGRVHLLEYVADALLEEFYRMADVFVYLSTYEGFGIPPMEALSYGIPAILSKTPAMDSVYEGAARFVTIEPREVSSAIFECVNTEEKRRALTSSGLRLCEKHSWQRTAEIISADWERLVAG